jgi:hypothetical protein
MTTNNTTNNNSPNNPTSTPTSTAISGVAGGTAFGSACYRCKLCNIFYAEGELKNHLINYHRIFLDSIYAEDSYDSVHAFFDYEPEGLEREEKGEEERIIDREKEPYRS